MPQGGIIAASREITPPVREILLRESSGSSSLRTGEADPTPAASCSRRCGQDCAQLLLKDAIRFGALGTVILGNSGLEAAVPAR